MIGSRLRFLSQAMSAGLYLSRKAGATSLAASAEGHVGRASTHAGALKVCAGA